MAAQRFPFEARRIAIVKPSALGDVVQTLPILAALRGRFPAARISWIVQSVYAPLLRPISMLDEVIEFDRKAPAGPPISSAAYVWGFLRDLRRARFDFAVDLQGLLRTGAFALATGARRRWGLRSAREGSRFAYTRIIDDVGGPQGAVDRYWRFAEALGVGDRPKEFPLEISPAERREALKLVDGLPRPWIAVQPGARWLTKRWPAASFAEAMESTLNQLGGSAVVLGSPDELNVATETAEAIHAPKVVLAGKTSLRILAAVLEQCDALLTNDTGPMHLAAAVGTPTTAVFTCTSPSRAGPFGSGHEIVQTNVACRESYIRRCDSMACMSEVTPTVVSRALIRCLERNAGLRKRTAV